MIPIGIDHFEKLRTNDFYYVDKTGLIIDLLHGWCEVTLFTRPRRFGKSLNMSMLEAFFSPDTDKGIFDGLKITEETELCEKYMGKYPVISLSLKGINASRYNTAAALTAELVRETAQKFEEILLHSDALTASEKVDFNRLLDVDMPEQVLFNSLKTLSGLLKKHYGRNTIVLLDEYDVPLAKAYEQGYYDQMVILIRNLFENVLKSNKNLEFAVLTGCMRISKESIFTGLNNLQVRSVTDAEFAKYFGFTDTEVRDILEYYDLSAYYETVKDWYDGYRFGQTSIYCPWDVLCYCKKLCIDSEGTPENYWINSSGNHVVRKLIENNSNALVKGEIEALINGESVEKIVHQELTYQEMYASIDNIWSVLFTTGYLTQKERINSNKFRLLIPNREVRDIFAEQILEMFREETAKDGEMLERICGALLSGDTPAAEEILSE